MAKNYIRSFSYAFTGIKTFFKLEPNAYIHSFAALAALGLAYLENISASEWLFLLLAIALVFASEMLNTALEKFCDLYSTEQNPVIKQIKDLSAGAVLICSIFALAVGTIIFIPKWI